MMIEPQKVDKLVQIKERKWTTAISPRSFSRIELLP